ncbi:hypothetical protein FUAX_13130 [Fulvitalea axinellae]|uniref:DUF4173 domain-containing protein n=1 Tax=Fulvitalea axinellae TaxID=1182444 RepID=A0AAU9CIY5_9BACT|nr:hypothetical protein FUAX_13130 [Fulvitalea axinellae]
MRERMLDYGKDMRYILAMSVLGLLFVPLHLLTKDSELVRFLGQTVLFIPSRILLCLFLASGFGKKEGLKPFIGSVLAITLLSTAMTTLWADKLPEIVIKIDLYVEGQLVYFLFGWLVLRNLRMGLLFLLFGLVYQVGLGNFAVSYMDDFYSFMIWDVKLGGALYKYPVEQIWVVTMKVSAYVALRFMLQVIYEGKLKDFFTFKIFGASNMSRGKAFLLMASSQLSIVALAVTLPLWWGLESYAKLEPFAHAYTMLKTLVVLVVMVFFYRQFLLSYLMASGRRPGFSVWILSVPIVGLFVALWRVYQNTDEEIASGLKDRKFLVRSLNQPAETAKHLAYIILLTQALGVVMSFMRGGVLASAVPALLWVLTGVFMLAYSLESRRVVYYILQGLTLVGAVFLMYLVGGKERLFGMAPEGYMALMLIGKSIMLFMLRGVFIPEDLKLADLGEEEPEPVPAI